MLINTTNSQCDQYPRKKNCLKKLLLLLIDNYKVVQIWPGQTVTCLHTNSPSHIWTTLYFWCCSHKALWLDIALSDLSPIHINLIYLFKIIFIFILLFTFWTAISQSVQPLATGWTVQGSNPGAGKIFRTRPDRPCSPPSLLYNSYRVNFRWEMRPGRGVNHEPLLASRLKKK
jgi:hypothetical protein